MGLFNRFKKKEVPEEQGRIETFNTIDKSDWLQVFSACLGKMMVIQNNASEYVVKGRGWHVDFSEGTISFGEDKFPVQFIGSESSRSGTWMWGWNNVNNFPESLILLPNEMLKLGETWNLDPLRTPQFELSDILSGHTLSIAACCLSNEDYFYYRGPHNGGAVLMAVGDVPKDVFRKIGIHQFADLTMQCIQQFPVDHKIFVESLLQWNRTGYDWDKDTLTAHFSQDLFLTFEQKETGYRIISMKTK